MEKFYIVKDEHGYWVKRDWFSRPNGERRTDIFPEPQASRVEAEGTLKYWRGY